MTHSTSWSAGIVGAPVTDWRDYDTVYTERLMKLPKNNPDGYRRTAPRFAADKLQGRLLLLHGTMDDNVHMQNSVQFAYELQKAGKPFRYMEYPRSRHGISEPALVAHLRATMLAFIEETLLGDPLDASASSRVGRTPRRPDREARGATRTRRTRATSNEASRDASASAKAAGFETRRQPASLPARAAPR
jgi:hypothetical protein